MTKIVSVHSRIHIFLLYTILSRTTYATTHDRPPSPSPGTPPPPPPPDRKPRLNLSRQPLLSRTFLRAYLGVQQNCPPFCFCLSPAESLDSAASLATLIYLVRLTIHLPMCLSTIQHMITHINMRTDERLFRRTG